MEKNLNLAEELLLLAMHEKKGTVLLRAQTALPYGLAGALLIEVVSAGLLHLEGKKLVASPSGYAREELFEEVLAKVRSSSRTHTLKYWVLRMGRSGGKIKKKLLTRLVEKGILQQEERRVLGIFPTQHYPEADSRPESEIRRRIQSGILKSGPRDERTAALISLAYACDLIGLIFEKGERREAKRMAKEITKSQPVGSAVAHAVAAIKAAVIIASSS
jgi:golgi phosphoprotein 3